MSPLISSYAAQVTRRFGMGLSREVWLVQIGIFLDALGCGAVCPFEIIYPNDGRGFALGAAGANAVPIASEVAGG